MITGSCMRSLTLLRPWCGVMALWAVRMLTYARASVHSQSGRFRRKSMVRGHAAHCSYNAGGRERGGRERERESERVRENQRERERERERVRECQRGSERGGGGGAHSVPAAIL